VFSFTLKNYTAVLDATYMQIVVRSIVFAGLTTAICLLMGYPVAYFIGRAPERWRNTLLMLVMVPFWTSFLIRTYAGVTILTNEGLLSASAGSAWRRMGVAEQSQQGKGKGEGRGKDGT